MPMNRADYHPDWEAMSRSIREQAGQRCEWCGVANGAVGARDCRGRWHDEDSLEGMNSTEGFQLWPDGYPDMVRIILTVHHQCDCDKRVCWDPSHMVALCQRCHLNADRPKHIARRRESLRRKGGQTEMVLP